MRRLPSFPFAASLLFAAVPAVRAQAPLPDSPAIEQKADAMLAKLPLEEKIDLIGGVDSMFIREMPDAGFPRLKMSDGPEGVRTWGPDTAYAGGIALSATWDPALAGRMGASIGDDARARGVNFLLAPGVDIYRAPMNGRNFEYLGEDPFLAARTAVAFIEGVQSRGVVATVKHFAANNSEFDRHNISADVDERTLREIYLPAFEAAVREAHVGAVMDSYNLVNGVHSTQNRWLNLEVLKHEWGFDGILMSDWSATYDGVAAANAGLDLEMPQAKFMNRENLLPAIKDGAVSAATIDDKVRRIFRTALRFGFLDRPQLDPGLPLYSQEGRQVALDEARESIVLLKNKGGLLPLDPDRIRTIAVIGPDAWPAVPGGGGSSIVTPYRATSIMTGVSDFLGRRARVLYVEGLPTPEEIFQQTDFDHANGRRGVKMEVFDNGDFAGTPSSTTYVARADQWKSEMWTPPAPHPRTVRWSASYTPRQSGRYLFLAAAGGEDRYDLYVDHKLIIAQQLSQEGQVPAFAYVPLEAGRTVAVRLDYRPFSDHFRAGFGVVAAADLVAPDTVRIAASADAALVCVGFSPDTEREGLDRTFALPWGQDELISAVAGANPRTIVTVTSGGGVDMRRWIGRVPALLENWYPGQEGGTALAEILFGVRSPEGRLPASFEHSWEENPVSDFYYPPAHPADETPRVRYGEGVFLGYRYYTSTGHRPLFPFGFGLSYTSFTFSRLTAAVAGDGTAAMVGFDVTNTGSRPGAEVAQLYVGDPSAKIARPVKELKGFAKVRLQPGETRHVELSLDRRSFAYFDATAHQWRIDPGRFVIYVGDSSEHTPLQTNLDITGSDLERNQTILFGP